MRKVFFTAALVIAAFSTKAQQIQFYGLEKAKVFLELHPELQAYLIYSDENGMYQIYETPGIKALVSEVIEEKKFSLFKEN